jgi:quercetin dioxygenase-like cupin family protein
MKKLMLATAVAAVLAAPFVVLAQDPVKVDAKHYKVEFENDEVRVLRITYGPGEESVMHEHPGALAVFLNDGKVRFTNADGTKQDQETKAGTSQWTPAGKHLPENTGTKPFEVLLVEVKPKPAAKN